MQVTRVWLLFQEPGQPAHYHETHPDFADGLLFSLKESVCGHWAPGGNRYRPRGAAGRFTTICRTCRLRLGIPVS